MNNMKPVGEWNHVVITCDGPLIICELNGERVMRANLNEFTQPFKRPDGSEHKFDRAMKDQPREGYVGLTAMLFSEFEALSFEARRYVDAGEVVFVEGHFNFRHRRTGRIADSDWLARFDLRDGRIAGGQFYENTHAVAAARR